ncbi:MAG: hypothetical protein AAFY88_04165 [Acidobacteriota bacterium]
MPDPTPNKTHGLPLGFTSKPIQRSTLKGYLKAVVAIRSGVAGPTYSIDKSPVEDLAAETFEGLVCNDPKAEGCLVTFRHPRDPSRVIGVVLADGDTRPEIDGVWVADDGGGKDGGPTAT